MWLIQGYRGHHRGWLGRKVIVGRLGLREMAAYKQRE